MSTTTHDAGATPGTPEPGEDRKNREAWEATAPERAAVDAKRAPRFTYEPFHAAGNAIHTARAAGEHRATMLLLPDYEVRHLDGLERYARAILFVQTEILRRAKVIKEVPKLAEEGYKLRALMLVQAEVLSLLGKIEPELVKDLREGSGYRDLVEDLHVLVAELRTQPAAIIGDETAVTRAHLDRAADLAHQINVRIGHEASLDLSHSQLLDERTKLGALLGEAHAEVRRAIEFIRFHHDDAAKIVPSLYVPSGPRKAGQPETEAPVAEASSLAERLQQATAHLAPEDNPFTTEA